MKNNKSLKQHFIVRMFLVVVGVAIITGLLQFYYLYQEVKVKVANEASTISKSIEQGIQSTDLAAKAIEEQLDYKINSISQRVSDRLPASKELITNDDLLKLSKEMKITGISIFAKEKNIVSIVKSSEPDEVGFTLEGISKEGNDTLQQLLNEEKPTDYGITSYVDENSVVLFTAQAGSRENPEFFKYAYYHKPGTDYIISTFIEADEVNRYLEKVGPDVWIENLLEENEYAKEIAVLDPRVYANPSLAEDIYPPLQKVVHGKYSYTKDDETIIEMIDKPKTTSSIEETKDGKIYKMFIPFDEERVIFIGLDYEKMSAPLKKYSLIQIVFGFLSLLVLFILSTRFFSDIYENIGKIIKQIKLLEKGDFTAQSLVEGGGELGDLSDTTNKMAKSLKIVMSETLHQANQTQKLAYLLEADATQSVEEIYTLSMKTTTEVREGTENFQYFINQITSILENCGDEQAQVLLTQIPKVQEFAKYSANSATEMTITLANILTSLQNQSVSLSTISKKLLDTMNQFEVGAKLVDEKDFEE